MEQVEYEYNEYCDFEKYSTLILEKRRERELFLEKKKNDKLALKKELKYLNTLKDTFLELEMNKESTDKIISAMEQSQEKIKFLKEQFVDISELGDIVNMVICPRCEDPSEFIEGCNHILCPYCNYEFCKVCKESYDNADHLLCGHQTLGRDHFLKEPKKIGKLSAFVGTLAGVDERTTKKDSSLLRQSRSV